MAYVKKNSGADESATETEGTASNSTTPRSLSRKARPIINGRRDVLRVKNKEPGYFYRVFNANTPADAARIEEYKELGYEVVQHPLDLVDRTANTVSTLGATANVHTGGGTKGLVMRIPQDYYDEDQKAKQRAIWEQERAAMDKSGHRDVDFGSVQIKNT